MYDKDFARTALREINWVEGAIEPILESPYRYRIVVHCSSRGRQKALFANGEHSYYCYVEIVSDGGQWIKKGANMVPVLPDDRLLMVVEQRPAQKRYQNPVIAEINGRKVDLREFGDCSSLEFPGGAVEPREGLKAGFLRELIEETGVQEQKARYYGRCHPIYVQGSDLALQSFLGVVFLSGLSYKEYVRTDGGLNVFALTRDEVQRNIWSGVIHSGQAGILQWNFYQEIEALRRDPILEQELVRSGYIRVEDIKIALPPTR